MNKVTIIVAISQNNIIGNDNKIPWHCSEDLKQFKQITTGHIVIMGRKTFESLNKKPLRNRINFVVSSDNEYDADGAIVISNPDTALRCAKYFDKSIFIIGGESIYKHFLPIVDELIISVMPFNTQGDTEFPTIDSNVWKVSNENQFVEFTQLTYKRK